MHVLVRIFLIKIVFVYSQSDRFPDCASGPLSKFPICDQTLPSRERAADLISRMTIDEKISQMVTTASAIPRLGLPQYEWWSEALHGLAFSPGVSFNGSISAATSFPMPINFGASFNMRLVHQETVAVALHAGTDLNCGYFYYNYTKQALEKQTIVEADIDRALERTFNILIRLGWFDPPEQQYYRQLTKDNVDTHEARQLSLESAQEGIVLLKNMNQSLPLDRNRLLNKRIALIGPTANATELMQGSYFGKAPFLIDPVTAIKALTTGKSIDVQFVYGCKINGSDESGFSAAIELARTADVVIFFGGLDQTIESETIDRVSIAMPDIQLALLQQLERVVQSPIRVVIMSGSGLDLTYVRDSPRFGSLIWMGYAGQSGGLAIANVIFGEYNPAGRLPITIYPASYVDAVSMFDMQMRPSKNNPGRTYKFYTGEAVYEFGTGLSYTTFHYSWSNDTAQRSYSISSLIENKNDAHRVLIRSFRVNVTNIGTMPGDDVILAFVKVSNTVIDGPILPIKQLFGFDRIHLGINETKEVFFPLNVEHLLIVEQDGTKWLYPGTYNVLIGQQLVYAIELYGPFIQWQSKRQFSSS
ncbi:unnamed protein product [Adineta ricciae]|uniref:Fibronectin type III-like domain-containing protein n=1 Tax=Adineta ricciae TaxID=249248 RepID=A0A815ABN2_ADIRI|nr:unnamed protein product [Adineta ricciae]